MAGTGYELARVNRLQQVDAALESRVTALSQDVRETYRDGPLMGGRGRGPHDFEDRGRHGGFPGRDGRDGGRRSDTPPDEPPPGPPFGPDRSRTTFALSDDTQALFGPATGFYDVVWFRDGRVISQSPNAPNDVASPASSDRDTLPHFRTRGPWREVVHCTGIGECGLAGTSLDAELAALDALRSKLILVGLVVLAAGLGTGWWITTSALRPIGEISAAAVRISAGDLSERVRATDTDSELGKLASVLNSTFGRLEAAFARQREFTADAAHELRTPLAVLISEAQTTLARERSAEEYRATVVGALDTAQQMRRLTESLLTLARMDGGAALLRGPVDLAGAARDVADRLKPLFVAASIPVNLELAPAVGATSRDRIDLVLTNLLSNALAYNRPGGHVTVTTSPDATGAVLVVADTGVGIAADDVPHVFERFYRADKSRSRADGHAGLGLSICRMIVEADGGTIAIASVQGQGTTVTVHLAGNASSGKSAGQEA
jgi:signal transduction histidine kinase